MTPPPVLIPIHSSEQVPEWAMLEINGELIQPKELSVDGKENPASHDDDELPLIASDSVELGAVRFDEEVRM